MDDVPKGKGKNYNSKYKHLRNSSISQGGWGWGDIFIDKYFLIREVKNSHLKRDKFHFLPCDNTITTMER